MTLNPLFCDHLVLQRNREIRIFGEGQGHITICFLGETKTMESDTDTWEIVFPAHSAGGPYTMNVILGDEHVSISDIYIGDVYLLAGQSNAELKMSEIEPPKADLCPNESIRFFHIPQTEKTHLLDNRWDVATEANIPEWSAIAYYLAASLSLEAGVAVGFVGCYQGAAVIESFIPKDTLAACGILLPEDAYHPDRTNELFADWNGDGWIYENMFRRIPPVAFRAAVWYQGESNTGTGECLYYDTLLAAMIRRWREDLAQPALPFAIVQINDYIYAYSTQGWEEVQKAQLRAAAQIPHCAPVIIRDLGDETLIHPVNKKQVSARIHTALTALMPEEE